MPRLSLTTALVLAGTLPALSSCTETSKAGPAPAAEQRTLGGGDVTPQAFSAALAAQPGAVLLDVRTAREWNEGHLAGAQRWDYFDTAFRDSLATVPVGGPVFVYCAAGGRSGEAATMLKELGHREVYNLAGGFDAWERAGLPFEKP